LVTALVLPALAVAADGVMRRWRVVAPAVAVVLVIGIPGNIDAIVDYMDRPIVTNQAIYKRMMLSLPRVPAAKEVPRDAIPERELTHFVTIGWLLDGADSGRIPKPARITAVDAAMDEIRLSLRQLRSPGIPRGFRCTSSGTPLLFRLKRGQRIVVSAPSGTVEVTPATPLPGAVFPFHVITVEGPILRAVRPVSFRTGAVAVAAGNVCAAPPVLRSARFAGAS
jgi:hypothetical protein